MMSPQVNYALYAFLIEENKRKIEGVNRRPRQTHTRPIFKLVGNLLVRLGSWLQKHDQHTDPTTVAHTM